ncbi:uncharacterized protein si:ch1073-83n3.2 [Leucoraja erinacea]|uniref:uncharacterized protein si:ch1073-83n3.2 n=1 Tax=Leucoraja erinaceus TaxID=7782 RepID=UPI002457332C|nr:uncharacterized protein si:ch1073-83n3.2 [Leucoraja erinacea]
MSARGIRQGYLKKYGGFVFKQWKEKFFFLSLRGSLAICRDHDSLPEAEVPLDTSCHAILKGSQISDLPRLPLGAERDCCLGLVLSKGKLLLLLAADSEDSSQWIKVLKKVKESITPSVPTCMIHVDKQRRVSFREKECAATVNPCQQHEAAARPTRSKVRWSAACLRHGAPSRKVVRAACLLVGGAAVGPTLGYTVTSPGAQPSDTALPDFKELGIHSADGCQEADCGYNPFDCETMDHDFDTFDFGGFAF